MAGLDGSIHKLLMKLSKVELLIMDDFGLVNLDQQQRIDLMEIIVDWHTKGSTIIASQLLVDSWHTEIGDNTLSDAILDRIVHTSHRIELKGESLRKRSNIVRPFVGNPENQKSGCQYCQKGVNMTRISSQSHRLYLCIRPINYMFD